MSVKRRIVVFFRMISCLWMLFISNSARSSSGETSYPARLVGDTISFSGHDWIVKDSKGKVIGPGKNHFSSSTENVWSDSLGKLHLRMTYRDERWYCPEVHLLNSLGSGTYSFHLDGNLLELDKDVVIGLFLYDYSNSDKNHNELDIEISKWGKDHNINGQFVIQPDVEKAFRFDCDLRMPSVHSISVEKKTVEFSSRYEGGIENDKKVLIAQEKMKLRKPYQPEADRACINVWLYKASEPTNLKEYEIVISRFEFTPVR